MAGFVGGCVPAGGEGTALHPRRPPRDRVGDASDRRGLVWLIALAAAYPYLPGSGSEAFKGLSLLVGLMLSLGSTGVVAQATSGLVLIYSRALATVETASGSATSKAW